MTVFDLLLIMLIAISVGLAAYRGGLAELSTLVALGVGAGAGLLLAAPMAAAIGRGESTITILAAGGVIAVVGFLVASIGFGALLRLIRFDSRQRMIDRIGGGAFGFLRALAVIGLGFLGYAYYLDADKRPPAVSQAFLLPLAEGAADIIESFAPEREPLNLGGNIDGQSSSPPPPTPATDTSAQSESQSEPQSDASSPPGESESVEDPMAAILQEVDS